MSLFLLRTSHSIVFGFRSHDAGLSVRLRISPVAAGEDVANGTLRKQARLSKSPSFLHSMPQNGIAADSRTKSLRPRSEDGRRISSSYANSVKPTPDSLFGEVPDLDTNRPIEIAYD